jgi:hypothetical protein
MQSNIIVHLVLLQEISNLYLGAQNPRCQVTQQLNLVWWCLIFVGTEFEPCFRPPFCHLEV